jgi:hypothetical protein
MRKTFEMVQIAVIGALTGAFIGGIVLRGGAGGAVWSGSALAVVLAAVVWPLLERPTALMRLKYGTVAFLPGLLVGGSQWVSFGGVGAAVGGVASSALAAFFASRLIERQEAQGRYIRTRFHYAWLFFGGSLATFFVLNALFAVERAAPWQTWARSISMAVQSSIVLAFVLLGYMICIGWKKRKTGTWRQARVSARREGATLLIGGMLLIAASSMFHYGFWSVHTAARFVGPLLSYVLGWMLPCTVGFLLAANRHRPVLGSVLVMTGAIFVLIVGISVFPMLLLPGSGLMWAGLVTGLVMIVLAVLSIIKPQSHVTIGSFLILASILSFVGAAGGLIIGGIMGLLGGALVVGWSGKQTEKQDGHSSPPASPFPPHSSTMTG